ncbi:MAG: semialdehyde dehydrogenase [Bryobacterales bacterium]|nr:semialdehyde dehydrogenase [Bryobacterales bacterium]
MTAVALMGAGGKMGLRLADNLNGSGFALRCVEIADRGKAALAERGLQAMAAEEALDGADVAILAVPDNRIGQIAHQISPLVKAGTMVVVLDAAAPYAGDLPKRDDISYFITHPCHPPVFSDETDPQAQRDFFGCEFAEQHIVCALMQGPEEHYALGEAVARAIYKPVMRSHRCTLEQMAILEPVLSETVLATCLTVIGQAMDEAVHRGVPKEAARDFLLGHMRVELAIIFQEKEGAVFSDGALKAIDAAMPKLFRPDWRKVFDPEELEQSIREITKT